MFKIKPEKVRPYFWTYGWTYVGVHMSTFTRTFVRTYVRSQVRTHTHTYAHTYVRMYTPDHTRTYTRASIRSWPVVAICPAYTPQHVYETLNFAKSLHHFAIDGDMVPLPLRLHAHLEPEVWWTGIPRLGKSAGLRSKWWSSMNWTANYQMNAGFWS